MEDGKRGRSCPLRDDPDDDDDDDKFIPDIYNFLSASRQYCYSHSKRALILHHQLNLVIDI